MKRFVVFLVLVGLAVPGLAGTAWYQVENIDTTWYQVEPTEDTMKAESLKPPTVRSPLDSWIDGFSFGGVEMIEDTIRVWDCSDSATFRSLDSAEAWADSVDFRRHLKAAAKNSALIADLQGVPLGDCGIRHLLYFYPGSIAFRWVCDSEGNRYNWHYYIPFNRVEIRCGDRVWRIIEED